MRAEQSRLQVVPQAWSKHPQLAECLRLDLTDTLAGDAEIGAELLEGLRRIAVEAEAPDDDLLQPRFERLDGRAQLDSPRGHGGGAVRGLALHVLDQVAVEGLAVADGRLERHRVADQLEQLGDALARMARDAADLLERRVAVERLRERAARALHLAHLLGDVHRQADRAALVGERAIDRLADPPGGVGRKLEAELVVELLDGPDEA